MKTYARIQDGQVAELLATEADIAKMFHRDIMWVNVTSVQGVAVGWQFDGQSFLPPASPDPVSVAVSLAELQAQIAVISAKLQALSAQS